MRTYSFPVDTSNIVCLAGMYSGDRYNRFETHVCITKSAISLEFNRVSMAAAGARLPFSYPQYGLFFGDSDNEGVERARYTRVGSELHGAFTGTLGTEPDGPYLTRIVAYDASGARVSTPTECFVPFWVWIDRNGTAKDHPMVVFQTGNYDWSDYGNNVSTQFWALVPKSSLKTRVTPQKWYYIPKANVDPINAAFPGVFPGGEPFDTALTTPEITRINFTVPFYGQDMNVKRPAVTSRGITVTENMQPYFWSDAVAAVPRLPQADGPRGVGQVMFPMAFWVSHAGSAYFCDTYRFGKVLFDGTVKTFAGLRHQDALAPYWEDMRVAKTATSAPRIEIVGNWDASIPVERRFPWESWGLVADLRTTHQDPSLPTKEVSPFGMLPQHLRVGSTLGPTFFATCRFGRILRFMFDRDNPSNPPEVREWVTGLSDPWGLATDQKGTLYVAERLGHKISAWSADTPQTNLGDVLATADASDCGYFDDVSLRQWEFPRSFYGPAPYSAGNPDLTIPRSKAVVAPEGLAYQDGYLYYASLAQGEVRRVNLTTKAIEVVCRPQISFNQNSRFLNVGLSDGTFGPRGTVFTSSWAVGWPEAYLPVAGAAKDGTALTNSKPWIFHSYITGVTHGPNASASVSYATVAQVSNGMLFCGGSMPGVEVFTKATLGEPPTDYARAQRGYNWYCQQGYRLLYGSQGNGFVDLPLPWGQNADCDYWLTMAGHEAGGADNVAPAAPASDLATLITWS